MLCIPYKSVLFIVISVLSFNQFRKIHLIVVQSKCLSIILIMANSDSDDILSADFLEPGELLDSDDELPDNDSSSARTSQPFLLNRSKVCLVVN